MTLLYSEIKDDLSHIINGIQQEDRVLASPFEALKVSSGFPILILISNILCWFVAYVLIVFNGDNSGLGFSFYTEAAMLFMRESGWISLGLTAGFSVFHLLMFYSTSLIYVSIPIEIRNTSKVAKHIKANLLKVGVGLWLLASTLSLVGIFTGNHTLLFSYPACLFVSIFIFNGYLGMETVRYGLGPLISKLSDVRK